MFFEISYNYVHAVVSCPDPTYKSGSGLSVVPRPHLQKEEKNLGQILGPRRCARRSELKLLEKLLEVWSEHETTFSLADCAQAKCIFVT